ERSEVRISDTETANAGLEAANAGLETRIRWLRDDHNLLQKALAEERRRGEAMILDLLRRHEEIVACWTARGLARRFAQLIALGRRMRGRRKHRNAIETIRQSIFFDPIWYQREYPDIATAFP